MNRKIIWGVPAAMVILGLLVVLISYVQPAYTATVTEKGQVYYTPAKKSGRSRQSARYSVTLRVEYTDDRGEKTSAEIGYLTLHANQIPEVGDQIALTSWLNGMVPHPNRTLIGIGGGSAVIGGFFLFLFLLTAWSMKRKRKLHGEGRES